MMTIAIQTTHMQPTRNAANASTPCDAHAPTMTPEKKRPISNRQKPARLEILATHTKQNSGPLSNRHISRPSAPSPWIQLQLPTLQLQRRGHLHRKNSASTPAEPLIVTPAPQGRQRLGRSVRAGARTKKHRPSARVATGHAIVVRGPFLITASAIRNPRNPNKTNTRGHF
jgi:hypothetical protein